MRKELRNEQKRAGLAIDKALLAGEKRILVISPPGSGKTGTYLDLLERRAREGTGGPSVIMTPRRGMAKRMMDEEVPKFAPALQAAGAFQKFTPASFDPNALIQVATYYSGIIGIQDGLIKQKDKNIIILDEAHHALSDLRKAVLSDPDAIYIAFTATPNFYQSKGLRHLGFKTVYNLSRQEAIDAGTSAPVRNILISPEKANFSLDDIVVERGDFVSASFEEALLKEAPFIQTLARFVRDWINPHTGKPLINEVGVINCGTVNLARFVAHEFNRVLSPHLPQGINACKAVWGVMPPKEHKDAMEEHARKETRILTSASLLGEGYNNPHVSYVLNIVPSMSAVVVEQRCRATSVDETNPDKMALMIDVAYREGHRAQLFFSDVANGALFERTQYKSEKYKSVTRLAELPQVTEGLSVHFTVEEIATFKKQSDTARAMVLNPELADLPDTRVRLMIKKGYHSLDDIYRAVQGYAKEQGWFKNGRWAGRGSEFARLQITALMKGEKTPFISAIEYSKSAIAISRLLGAHPVQVFGSAADNKPFEPEQKPSPLAKEFEFVSLDETLEEHDIALRQFIEERDPLDNAANNKLSDLIFDALLKMTPRHEYALRRHYFEEATQTEIADSIFVSAGRMGQILNYASDILKVSSGQEFILSPYFLPMQLSWKDLS